MGVVVVVVVGMIEGLAFFQILPDLILKGGVMVIIPDILMFATMNVSFLN